MRVPFSASTLPSGKDSSSSISKPSSNSDQMTSSCKQFTIDKLILRKIKAWQLDTEVQAAMLSAASRPKHSRN